MNTFELADYLESMAFSLKPSKFMKILAPNYPESYISLAQIASEEDKWERGLAYLEEITSDSDWYVTAPWSKPISIKWKDCQMLQGKINRVKQLSDEPLVTFGLLKQILNWKFIKLLKSMLA